MRGYRWLLCGLVLVGAFCLSGTAAEEEKPKYAKQEQILIELTNKARAKEKLPPLKTSALLAKIGRAHSANMAKQQKAAHVLDGKTHAQRIDEGGYDYLHCGENLAAAEEIDPRTLQAIVDGWMKSKDHRENIVRKEFEEIGIGIVKDPKGDYYVTQLFGTLRKKP